MKYILESLPHENYIVTIPKNHILLGFCNEFPCSFDSPERNAVYIDTLDSSRLLEFHEMVMHRNCLKFVSFPFYNTPKTYDFTDMLPCPNFGSVADPARLFNKSRIFYIPVN